MISPITSQNFDVACGITGTALVRAARVLTRVNQDRARRATSGHIVAKSSTREVLHGIDGIAARKNPANAVEIFLKSVRDDFFNGAVANGTFVGSAHAQSRAVG